MGNNLLIEMGKNGIICLRKGNMINQFFCGFGVRSLFISFFIFFFSSLAAQPFGNPSNFKIGELNNGRIFTVYSNYGILGHPVQHGPQLAWLKRDNCYYNDLSFITSMKVKLSNNSDFSDPIIKNQLTKYPDSTYYSSTDCPTGRSHLDIEESNKGFSLSFYPRNTFSSEFSDSVAISTNPNTWPSSWANFPSIFPEKKDEFIETIFILDDHSDDEYNSAPFNHVPIGNDPQRKGMGIRVEVRYLLPTQLYHGAYSDVLFMVHTVINESDYEYKDFMFSLLTGGNVGISALSSLNIEFDDDIINFDTTNKTIYVYDFTMENSRNPNWVGKSGFSAVRLVSPDKFRFGSHFIPSTNIDVKDDEALRSQLELVKTWDQPILNGADCDGVVSSDKYNLSSGDSLIFVSIIGFANKVSILDTLLAHSEKLWRNRFDYSGLKRLVIDFDSLNLKNAPSQLIPLQPFHMNEWDSCTVLAFNPLFGKEIDLGNYPLNANFIHLDLSELRHGEWQFSFVPKDQSILPIDFFTTIEKSGGSYWFQGKDNIETRINISANRFEIMNDDVFEIIVNRNFEFGWRGPETSTLEIVNLTKNLRFGPVRGILSDGDLFFDRIAGLDVTITNAGVSDKVDADLSFIIPAGISFSDITTMSSWAEGKLVHSKLLDFTITPGVDTSYSGIILNNNIPSIITSFQVKDLSDKDIPFIINNFSGSSSELENGDELILLYDTDIVTSWQDTAWGPQNSSYRFAQAIMIFSDDDLQKLEQAQIKIDRAYKGTEKLYVSGTDLLPQQGDVPESFHVGNSYPNPFNPSVAIRIQSPIRQVANLTVYNVLGQIVGQWNQQLNAGESVVNWVPEPGLSSGLYFISVSAGSQHQIRKAVFLK